MRSVRRPKTVSEALPGLRRTLTRFLPYLRAERKLVGGALLALLAAAALGLLEPWPLKFLIDRLVGASAAGGKPAFADLPTETLIPLCALALVVVVALKAGTEYLASAALSLVGNRVMSAVRAALFDHLQRLSLSFHLRRRTGELALRLLGDVGMLRETLITAALPLVANALMLVGMMIVMLILDWKLALVAMLPLPLLWISGRRISRRIREVSRSQRKRESAMAASAAESLAAIRTVQALSLEERLSEAFLGANRRSLKDGAKAGRLAAALERSVEVLGAVATALVLWYGARQVLRGMLTPGDLLVFLAYFRNAIRPARTYAKYAGRLAKASAAGERILELLDEQPSIRDAPGARALPRPTGTLRFENVRFAYDPDAPLVLDGLNLEIRAGERIAITGPSGAGKSTLASLILRLYDPVAGRVTVDGHDLRDVTVQSLRSQIDYVPQDTLLFAGSVHDNLALAAARDVTRAEIEAAARLAAADSFIEALPQGYDTLIGERGSTLSGGQRQRLAIARAALRGGPLLVFDEATAGLDGSNAQAVIDGLERLARGRTCIIITHDLAFAARADRILHLEGGRIVEEGSHAALLARNGRHAALWRLQPGIGAAA